MTFDEKLHLLKQIADESMRTPADRPYRCIVNDQSYIFATDDHHILAFAVTPIQADSVAVYNGKPETLAQIEQWLAGTIGKPVGELPFQRLCDWVKLDQYKVCPCCKGSGIRPFYIMTDDDGDLFDDFSGPDIQTIHNIPVDRNRIASVLMYLSPKPATGLVNFTVHLEAIHEPKDEQHSPMLFAADDWKYVLMPCNVEPEYIKANQSNSYETFTNND